MHIFQPSPGETIPQCNSQHDTMAQIMLLVLYPRRPRSGIEVLMLSGFQLQHHTVGSLCFRVLFLSLCNSITWNFNCSQILQLPISSASAAIAL